MSSVMMERTGMGMAGMGAQGQTMTGPAMPATQSWVMVPRCTFKFEKCTGGMKITCTCDDPASCTMMQNLCSMMQGGMCGCCVMMNGMPVCCCSLAMGMCKCDMTEKGCTVTFSIAFEFRSRLLNAVAGAAFEKVMFRMADAFEAKI